MANKSSGGPRFILMVLRNGEVKAVTSTESNSQAEYRRLRRKAKSLIVDSNGADQVKLYLVMEPEQLSQASLLTDLDVAEWLKEKTSEPQ